MEGTAVFESHALAMFMRVSAFGGPAKEAASELAATATTSPTGELPESVGSLRQMFVTLTSTSKLSFKTVRKALMKMVKAAAKKAAEAARAATAKGFYKAQVASAQRAYDQAVKKIADAAEERAKKKIATKARKDLLKEEALEKAAENAQKKTLSDALEKMQKKAIDAASEEAVGVSRRAGSIVGLGLLQSLVGDLQHDVVALWLDAMRTQCDGLAQVIGSTNPVAQLVKQACLLGPEGLEGMITVLVVLAVDYPIMHCVCKLPEGQAVRARSRLDAASSCGANICFACVVLIFLHTTQDSNEVIREICLDDMMPVEYEAWTRRLLRDDADGQQSMCFQSMDTANQRLLTAFDRFQSRMFKATQVVESTLDYLTAAFKVAVHALLLFCVLLPACVPLTRPNTPKGRRRRMRGHLRLRVRHDDHARPRRLLHALREHLRLPRALPRHARGLRGRARGRQAQRPRADVHAAEARRRAEQVLQLARHRRRAPPPAVRGAPRARARARGVPRLRLQKHRLPAQQVSRRCRARRRPRALRGDRVLLRAARRRAVRLRLPRAALHGGHARVCARDRRGAPRHAPAHDGARRGAGAPARAAAHAEPQRQLVGPRRARAGAGALSRSPLRTRASLLSVPAGACACSER